MVMEDSLFWADQLAKQVLDRAKKEKQDGISSGIPVIRTAQTPSGGKHIGNLNDVLRAHFVYKSLKDKGHKVRFVHTHDDRDPMKDVPGRLADLDAKWHNTQEFPELKKYLGVPLIMVPDPFGCCKSYGEHFSALWIKGLEMIGVEAENISTNALYEAGKFEPYVIKTFENIQEASRILAKHQSTKEEGYIPFVNTIGVFLTRRCYEQIAIDLCLENLPVRLISNGCGLVYAPKRKSCPSGDIVATPTLCEGSNAYSRIKLYVSISHC